VKTSSKNIGLYGALLLTALSAVADERILDFDSRIKVGADAVLTVTETIRVAAEGVKIKHGIYRDFPQLYRGKWGLRQKTGFDVVRVRRDGQDEPFHTERRANGQRVYIGSASVLVPPGVHVYELTYRTDRQLGFFADHDELYWNVTGNDWEFPIDRATATVELPADATAIALEAYTGAFGAQERHYSASPPGAAPAVFATTQILPPGEGFTIVTSWPRGFVAASARAGAWRRIAQDNPGLTLALIGLLLVFGYYAIVWAAVGKDPQRGVMIPLYGPPKSFSPAAVRYLREMGFDNKVLAAAILDLAVKGALTIRQESKLYTLAKREGTKLEVLPDEAALHKKLFDGSATLALDSVNHVRVGAAKKALQTALRAALEKIYFVRNSKYWFPGLLFSLVPLCISLMDSREIMGGVFLLCWLSLWTMGVTALLSSTAAAWRARHWGEASFLSLFSLPFVGGEIGGLIALVLATSLWVAVVFALGVTLNGFFYHLLKAPTLAGQRILDQIEGFRLYLSVAEKDRLNLENPPQRTPELFDRFLPYALALNVEQQWAQQFEDVIKTAGEDKAYRPAWYSGTAFATAGLSGFAGSLGNAFSGAISSASTAPGSHSGGGGGGSSGGGGGGGGGGGW
jgi:uncharacterized membrane protein YgcG